MDTISSPPRSSQSSTSIWGTDVFSLGATELFVARLAFAILIFFTIKWETGPLANMKPEDAVGLSRFIDLTFLAHLAHPQLWMGITAAGLAFYVVGWAPVLGLLPTLFFTLGIGTLAASQGATNHSTQLCTMILMGQCLVYTFPFLATQRRDISRWLAPAAAIHRRAFHGSLVIFVAGYVVCGWVKLQNSDWHWVGKVVPGLALELQKTNWSAYYDTLEPVPRLLSTTVTLISEHPTLARLFFGAGLLIELFAFLALLGRRWAFFFGLAIIALHLSISRLMQLDFWYHIWAAAIFLLNLPGLARTFERKRPELMQSSLPLVAGDDLIHP